MTRKRNKRSFRPTRTNSTPIPKSVLSELWELIDTMTRGSSLRREIESGAEAIAASLGLTGLTSIIGIKKSARHPVLPKPDHDLIEMLRPLFDFLYSVYFRVEARGMGHIPVKGPCLLVGNHAGMLPYDGAMINMALFHSSSTPRFARYLVEDFVFNIPLLGSFVQKCGGVRACHENAMALLDQGELVVVFPEGIKGVGKSYDERYRLRPFGHGGYVKLAMRTGVPILPMAIIGSEEIHPNIWKSKKLARPLGLPFIPFTPTFPWLGPLGLLPLPSKWSITFGKPLDFGRFTPKDAEDDRLVEEVSSEIRLKVQRMILTGLKKRKSIWI